jgi:hypothetical protein
MAARMPIFGKDGEEIFDLNNADSVEESAEAVVKTNKISHLVVEVQRVFRCDDSKHHGCCWISPPGSPEPGKHYLMDHNLQWSMAKLLVNFYH